MITDIRTWSTTDGYEYVQIRGWIGKRPIGSFESFEKVKSNQIIFYERRYKQSKEKEMGNL